MERDKAERWMEHPEVAGKVVRTVRRTDEAASGDSRVVIEFDDGTSLALGANDLGTWVENPEYVTAHSPVHPLHEAPPDYAMVKALAEQLAAPDQVRLARELSESARISAAGPMKRDRYAADFYGIWKGVVFTEDEFKAVEWYLPKEAIE